MKTTQRTLSQLWRATAGLLLFTVSAPAEEPARLVSELLEEGVYLEEAKGDLAAAIDLYKQIVESDQTNRAKAAEAQFRMAVCYQKMGNSILAAQGFEALVNNYPNQTKWVEAALEYLPQPFSSDLVPWVEGESSLLEMRLPTGYHVGYVIYRTELVEWKGRTLWRFVNRTLGSQEVSTMVEVDPENMEPVYGYMFGSNNKFGEISYWFEDEGVRMVFGDDPDAKTVSVPADAIDNLQAQYLIRQFPVKVGFSTKQTVFVGMSGATIPVVFEIVGIEDVETPIGTFECTHTEIRLGGQTQHFYVTTDEARRIVKFQVGEVEALAIRSDVVKEGEKTTLRNEQLGFEVKLPAEWSAVDLTEADGRDDRARIYIRDSWKPGDIAISVHRGGDSDDTVRSLAEKNAKSFTDKHGLQVDESSWREFEVPAGPAVSYRGTVGRDDKEIVLKATIVRSGDRAMAFTIRGEPDWIAENEAKLDAVVQSARIN